MLRLTRVVIVCGQMPSRLSDYSSVAITNVNVGKMLFYYFSIRPKCFIFCSLTASVFGQVFAAIPELEVER